MQGELLREIEKIRCEAQDNGNKNWDDDYSYFCDFISKKLSEQSIFSVVEKEEITLIMSYIKECGIYAQKFNSGKISENNVDIGQLQKENDKPVMLIKGKYGFRITLIMFDRSTTVQQKVLQIKQEIMLLMS